MSEREDYYLAARTWADGRVASSARETRIAWIAAGMAGAIALILALTLVFLVPLKTVEPFVVTVDRQTGTTEVSTTLKSGQLTQNEAVIQAQLAGYVVARETFDATDLTHQYRRVRVMSAPAVATGYVAQMAATNPSSPLRTLNKGDTIAIRVRSISLIAVGTAIVRFDAIRTNAGAAPLPPAANVAAISFGFSGRPLRMEDRYDNPLGFLVTRYRRDAEGLAP
ncbi:virB8 family protein [Blastomonas sp.]|uniref:virB8 family protein n=1 Tax=Blastomonas sp. TaxID=1909299 RepID=UPI00359379E9